MKAGNMPADMPPERLVIGADLEVVVVPITELREQDINAQVMQPRHFERLTENIRIRGQVESLPYCARPDSDGPIEIVSGHHRVRAARAAGLTQVPILLDTRPMRRSEIVAKQIAHNELHGTPDEDVLRQLVALMDNVDDMLASGLDETFLPAIESDGTSLALPHADFDWRLVTLMFLPNDLDRFREAAEAIDRDSELVGLAHREQFEPFADALRSYGIRHDIRSMATVVAVLTELARRELERDEADSVEPAPAVSSPGG